MAKNRMYTLIASAAAGGALVTGATALSPAAQAAPGDLYVMIAYSPITGYTGWATNATTMEEATHLAMGNCGQHGDGCEITSWAQNGCAALALGGGRWGGDWATNPSDAQAKALSRVPGGRIVELHCTG